MGSPKLKVMASGMSGIENKEPIMIRKIKENLYIIGDGITVESSFHAPRVTACAALMASVILEHFFSAARK